MRSKSYRSPRGVALVVAVVVLAGISIIFVGARAWKRGSDRAACIMNIRSVQMGVRSYQNLNDLKPGDPIDWEKARALQPGPVVCPSGGHYEYVDKIPPIGGVAAKCSHAITEGHAPVKVEDW